MKAVTDRTNPSCARIGYILSATRSCQEDRGKFPDRRLQRKSILDDCHAASLVWQTGYHHASQTRHERKLTTNQNRRI